jgi:hypothetical protein
MTKWTEIENEDYIKAWIFEDIPYDLISENECITYLFYSLTGNRNCRNHNGHRDELVACEQYNSCVSMQN